MDYSKVPYLGGTWTLGKETFEVEQQGTLLKYVANNGSKSYGEIYWDGAISKYRVVFIRRDFHARHCILDDQYERFEDPKDKGIGTWKKT